MLRRARGRTAGALAPRAVGAEPDQLGAVLDLREAVAIGHAPRPVVEAAVADLLDPPAGATRQMVVMAASTEQKRLFSGVAANRVGLALVGKALEVAVDGREADAVEPLVQLLRRDSGVAAPKLADDRRPLSGGPAHDVNITQVIPIILLI